MASRSGRAVNGATRRSQRNSASAVAVPAALLELAEDDEGASVHGDDLPVAPAQRPVGPPPVLDEPRLTHRDDLVAVDRERAATGARQHGHGLRHGETAAARA